MNDTGILINTQSLDYYRHIKDDTYKNLRTGVSGEIKPEIASKVFVLSVSGSEILNNFPIIEKLISLGFKNVKQ